MKVIFAKVVEHSSEIRLLRVAESRKFSMQT